MIYKKYIIEVEYDHYVYDGVSSVPSYNSSVDNISLNLNLIRTKNIH